MANKTGKGKVNATAKAEAEKKAIEAEQARQQSVSAQIQEVLEAENYALQPFLSFSEYGIVPRVRLVDNKMPHDEQAGDTPEAGAGEDEPEPSSAESA